MDCSLFYTLLCIYLFGYSYILQYNYVLYLCTLKFIPIYMLFKKIIFVLTLALSILIYGRCSLIETLNNQTHIEMQKPNP